MRTPRATAFGSFAYGWQQLWKHFLYLFLIGIIVAVANCIPPMVGGAEAFNTPGFVTLNGLIAAYSILVLPIVAYGAHFLYLQYMRDERANVAGVFDGFQKNYLNIVLANLLVVAICGIGLVLFVVPGIFFACRLAFVPYLVMDKGLEPVAAVEKSWAMTRGHGWRIFGMYLLAIPLVLVGFVLLFVGAFLALMWLSCAFASLYHAVDSEEQALLNRNGTV